MPSLLLKDVNEDSVKRFLDNARGEAEVTDDDVEAVLTAARARQSLISSRPFEEQLALRDEPFLTAYDSDDKPESAAGVTVVDPGGNV